MNIALQGWQDLQVAQPINPQSIFGNSSLGVTAGMVEKLFII